MEMKYVLDTLSAYCIPLVFLATHNTGAAAHKVSGCTSSPWFEVEEQSK